MITNRVDTQEARSVLASLNEKLMEHAERCDPAEIAEAAAGMMREVAEELKMLLCYLRAFDDTIGLDDLSLRDLLLAGDTILIDFLTPDGPGRLAVAVDDEVPVSFGHGPVWMQRQWQDLHAS